MKENNRLLIKQLEDHAKEKKLLSQVKKVVKSIKSIKVYKNKYLVIEK